MTEINIFKLQNYMKINKLSDNNEAKNQLEKEENSEKEQQEAPGTGCIDANEESMQALVYNGLLSSVIVGKKETIEINGINLNFKKNNLDGNFSYKIEDNQLILSGRNCIVDVTDLDFDNHPELENLDIIINGNNITFNSNTHVNSITNKGINNVINGSKEADNIINMGIDTIINAGAGNDTITSTGIKTLIRGGKGDDNINATGINTNIFGNDGVDNISAKGVNIFADGGNNNSESTTNAKENINVQGINIALDGGNGVNNLTGRGINIDVTGSKDLANDTSNEINLSGFNTQTANIGTNDSLIINNEIQNQEIKSDFSGLVDNIMYEKGEILTGISSTDNKLYKNGVLDTELKLYNDKLYIDGSIAQGSQIFENKLYIDGSIAQGNITFEGKMYTNGILADKLKIDGLYYEQGVKYTGSIKTTNENIETTYIYEEGKLKNKSEIDEKNNTTTLSEYDENEHLNSRTINNELSVISQSEFEYEDDEIVSFSEVTNDGIYTYDNITWNNDKMVRYNKTDENNTTLFYVNDKLANGLYDGEFYKDGIVSENTELTFLARGNNVILLNEGDTYEENENTNVITVISADENTIKTYTQDGQKISEERKNCDLVIDRKNVSGSITLTFSYNENEISTNVSINAKNQTYTSTSDCDLSYLSNDLINDLTFTENAIVSDKIKSDISILKNAENALAEGEDYNNSIKSSMIKDYTTSQKQDSVILNETNAGDIIEKNDGLYINDGNSLVKLNISADTYLELFQPVQRYDVAQSDINNCYFVASTLISSLENPKAFSKLLSMMSEDENRNLTICFDGMQSSPVTFYRDDDGNLLFKDNDNTTQNVAYLKDYDGNSVYKFFDTQIQYVITEDGYKIIDDDGNNYIKDENGVYWLTDESNNKISSLKAPLVKQGVIDEDNNCLVMDEEGNYYIINDNNEYEIKYAKNQDAPNITYIVSEDVDTNGNYVYYKADNQGNYLLDTQTDDYEQVQGSTGLKLLEQAYAIALFADQYNKEVTSIDVDDAIELMNQGNYQTATYNEVYGDSGILMDFYENKWMEGIFRTDGNKYNYNLSAENLDNAEKILKALKDELENNTVMIGVIFNTELDDFGIVQNHSYIVEKITDEYVSIINPWSGGLNIQVPSNTFYACTDILSVVEIENTTTPDTISSIKKLV